MKEKQKTKNKLEDKALKRDLLSFVMGGNDLEDGRCSAAGSKYADSIYVKKPDPIIIVKP